MKIKLYTIFTDSHKLFLDELIKQLKDKIKYSTTIITNENYNEMIDKGFNSHEIKTFVHLKNIEKMPTNCPIIMDQYASQKKFEEYSNNLNMKINHKILFHEKADSKFLSVSVASIFARYELVMYKHKLEQELGMKIFYGAGKDAVIVSEILKPKHF